MRKSVLVISFLVVSCVLTSNALAAAPNLASLDWSVKAPHNLAANPPADDVIKTFMGKLEGELPGICEAHFADLQHSGMLSLVVSENDGRFCHLSVVEKTAGGFRRYSFDLSLGVDGPEIKDLGGNGKLELIVPTDLTGYQGGGYCMARWPVIYAWTGNGYSDVSSHYKNYYEQQLAALQKEIAAAEAEKEQAERGSAAQGTAPGENASPAPAPSDEARSSGPFPAGVGLMPAPSPSPRPPAAPEPDRYGLDCTKAEAAKIERFLGISRDAGMSDAIKLANSDDPDDRAFAAWIFADIATPEAMSYLRTLSHDPESGVAISGKYALEQANQGPVVHTVEAESVAADAGAPSQ